MVYASLCPYLSINLWVCQVYNHHTFYLDGPYSEKWKKELFFGPAQIKKNYASFYLMPVYMYPDLLEDISSDLKRHMQGKSCFNFKEVEPELLQELSDLAKKSYEHFQKEELWK